MTKLKYEKEIFKQGYKLIGGVDEVGRGPLAGPVVAACVVCGPDFKITKALRQVGDSKKISASKREELYKIILESFEHVGVGICNHKVVDKINILQASLRAMKIAVGKVDAEVDYLLVDGKFIIPQMNIKQTAFVKGDERVFLIGQTIVAKVVRDKIMDEQHQLYPEYGFDKHKGYGTMFHMEKIKLIGPCPIHRRSFSPLKEMLG